jgi:acetyl/propionyl-CoA carboxylase alpha subunit
VKFETQIRGREGTLEIEGSRFAYQCNGSVAEGQFSIEPLEAGCYCVLMNGHSYRVSRGLAGELDVNGLSCIVEIFDPRALRTRGKGSDAQGRQNVAASMPGKVIRVLVAAGDIVEAGQGLVVVEAMKMQNEMKSPKAGRIVEVKTKAHAAVAAGDVLVVVE